MYVCMSVCMYIFFCIYVDVIEFNRGLMSPKVNPLWSPPVLPVSDAVFIDILSGRHRASGSIRA